jgi:hypothetical protein
VCPSLLIPLCSVVLLRTMAPGGSDRLLLSPGDGYFLQQDGVHASSDPVGVVDPSAPFSFDLVVGGACESAPQSVSDLPP